MKSNAYLVMDNSITNYDREKNGFITNEQVNNVKEDAKDKNDTLLFNNLTKGSNETNYGSVGRSAISSRNNRDALKLTKQEADASTFVTSNRNKLRKSILTSSSSSLLRSKVFWTSVVVIKIIAMVPFMLHRRLTSSSDSSITQEMMQYQTSYWETNNCSTRKCFNDKLQKAHLSSMDGISKLNSILLVENNDQLEDDDDNYYYNVNDPVGQKEQHIRSLEAKNVTQSNVLAATDGLNNNEDDESANDAAGSLTTKDHKKKKKHKKLKRPPSGCEVTVQIIRHCEKDILKDHCDYIGFERAQYLTTIYGNNTVTSTTSDIDDRNHHHYRWPVPSEIYALDSRRFTTKKHKATHLKKLNMREIETVMPLAIKYDLPVNDDYGMGSEEELAEHIFKELHSSPSSHHKREQCGRLILICWHHSKIATLAHMLGCGPTQGCPLDWNGYMEFDDVWEIRYAYDVASHQLPSQHAIPLSPQVTLNDDNDDTSKGSIASQKFMVTEEVDVNRIQQWKVYGTVVKEHFDPLSYSTNYGDYTLDGTTSGGGKWISPDVLSTEINILTNFAMKRAKEKNIY